MLLAEKIAEILARWHFDEHMNLDSQPAKQWKKSVASLISPLTKDVERLLAEARADEARRCAADVCEKCANPDAWKPAERGKKSDRLSGWWHSYSDSTLRWCAASNIHERLHRESEAKSVDK